MIASASHAIIATMNAKVALRQRLRAARRTLLEPARERAHRTMASYLLALLEGLPKTGAVALYASRPEEADPRGLLDLLPASTIAWPRVAPNGELELAVCAEAELVPGFRGILEPPREHPAIGLSHVRMIVVPGLAFDQHGARLGQGGGHYDRLLVRLRATAHPGLVVGLAYASQIIEAVPCEPHDQRVDLVVTESGLVGDA